MCSRNQSDRRSADLLGDRFARVGVHIATHHSRPILRECLGEDRAAAAGGPGDEHHLVRERRHRATPPARRHTVHAATGGFETPRSPDKKAPQTQGFLLSEDSPTEAEVTGGATQGAIAGDYRRDR
jgi:hypothetical protein